MVGGTMDVSVIIPTRGLREQFLNDAIESVRMQRTQPRELIVIVDGDEVALQRARKAIGAARLRVDIFGCTGVVGGAGVSTARNLGAEYSSTEKLAFLDDDDRWLPEFLMAFDNKSFDLGLAAFMKEREDGTCVPEKSPPACLHPRRFLVTNPGLRGSNVVIRREIFQSIGGFRTSLRALTDLDFGIRLSGIQGLRYRPIRKRLVIFRSHSQARITRPDSVEILQGVFEFWRLYHPIMSEIERERFRERALAIWRIDPAEGA